ncbi:YunG family protein [Actinophytocola sp.]|uniref:YunG family protein n=1 Tax=Actinophytocola sp. TaxID=1872138 RepID=UPI002ED0563C
MHRERVGYWNRFGTGLEVDLTREQFRQEETVVGGQVVQRPPGRPRRCLEQYDLLRGRVLDRLSSR